MGESGGTGLENADRRISGLQLNPGAVLKKEKKRKGARFGRPSILKTGSEPRNFDGAFAEGSHGAEASKEEKPAGADSGKKVSDDKTRDSAPAQDGKKKSE